MTALKFGTIIRKMMVTGGGCFVSRTESHCVTQSGLKFTILLPQALKCLDYRSVQPCLRFNFSFSPPSLLLSSLFSLLCLSHVQCFTTIFHNYSHIIYFNQSYSPHLYSFFLFNICCFSYLFSFIIFFTYFTSWPQPPLVPFLLFPLPMSPLLPPHSNTFQVLVRASIKVSDHFGINCCAGWQIRIQSSIWGFPVFAGPFIKEASFLSTTSSLASTGSIAWM